MFNLYEKYSKDSTDSKSQLIQYADDCRIYSSGTDSYKTG